MRSLVLEMEFILMYYGAGACDRVQCSMYSNWSDQVWRWSQWGTLKWQVWSSLEPMFLLHCISPQQGLLESKVPSESFMPYSKGWKWGDWETRGSRNYSLLFSIKATSGFAPHVVLTCQFVNLCHCCCTQAPGILRAVSRRIYQLGFPSEIICRGSEGQLVSWPIRFKCLLAKLEPNGKVWSLTGLWYKYSPSARISAKRDMLREGLL